MKLYTLFVVAVLLTAFTEVSGQRKNNFTIENEVFADRSIPEETVVFDFILPSSGKVSGGTVRRKKGDFAKRFLPIWKRAGEYTLETVRLMPADKFDYKPAEDVFSFREQTAHLVNSLAALQVYVTGKKEVPFETQEVDKKSKEELLVILEKALDYTAKVAENFPDSEMDDKVDFFVKEADMTKTDVFLLMRDHLTHHRAQMVVYLRLKGIKPAQYIGW